jgi:uroporphyrinogen decarboxylase
VALDNSVTPEWAAANVQVGWLRAGQPCTRAHGHGGEALTARCAAWSRPSASGPHIFNLGHGITPDANPDNVQLMIDTVRGA